MVRQNPSGALDVPRKKQRAMDEHGRQKQTKKFEQKVAKVTKGTEPISNLASTGLIDIELLGFSIRRVERPRSPNAHRRFEEDLNRS